MTWKLPDFPTTLSDLPTQLPGPECAARLVAAVFLAFHMHMNRG